MDAPVERVEFFGAAFAVELPRECEHHVGEFGAHGVQAVGALAQTVVESERSQGVGGALHEVARAGQFHAVAVLGCVECAKRLGDTGVDARRVFDAGAARLELVEFAGLRVDAVYARDRFAQVVRLLAHRRLLRFDAVQVVLRLTVGGVGARVGMEQVTVGGVPVQERALSGRGGEPQLVGLPMDGDEFGAHSTQQ